MNTLFKTIVLSGLIVTAASCKKETESKADSTQAEAAQTQTHKILVEGHRGNRGNYPENTIPAFISGLKKGADVLELDVVISKDDQVVISHEPYMSSLYVLTPSGDSIRKADEKSYKLYTMDYDSIRRYDSGSKGNKNFPEQQKMKTYKPLLSEMIDSVEQYVAKHNLKPVHYNIEIKSEKREYGKGQPQPEEFVDMVMMVINQKNIDGRFDIQSFDPVPLNILKKKYPEVTIAFLTAKPGLEKNLSQLDFTPDIYSPEYHLVNQPFADSVKAKNMKLIPWTVNNETAIDSMITYKVDGIITDYPQRVVKKL